MERKQLKLGMNVTLNKDFLKLPKGTEGELVRNGLSWPRTDLVAIQWKRYEGDSLIYYFNADTQLHYLD